MSPTARFTLTTSALLGLSLGIFWFSQHQDKGLSANPSETPSKKSSSETNKSIASNKDESTRQVPGKDASTSPEKILERDTLLAEAKATIKDPLILRDRQAEIHYLTTGIGTTPPIKNQSNPQAKSMIEALKTGKNPERVSPLLPPAPFDPDSYKSDPEAYLNVIEPGRVFQYAEPGEKVPVIDPVSEYWQEVPQGGEVTLSVKAAPGWPVTLQ